MASTQSMNVWLIKPPVFTSAPTPSHAHLLQRHATPLHTTISSSSSSSSNTIRSRSSNSNRRQFSPHFSSHPCVAVRSAAAASDGLSAVPSSSSINTPVAPPSPSPSPPSYSSQSLQSGPPSTKRPADTKEDDWSRILSSSLPLKGKVVKANTGGLVLRIAGTALLAFLPLSHLDPARLRSHALAQSPAGGSSAIVPPSSSPSPSPPSTSTSAVVVARSLVGELLTVKVLEADAREGRLLVSEKQAAMQRGIAGVEEGRVYEGVVTSVADFGAFVDVFLPDGAFACSGLVHLSELSWDRVSRVEDVTAVGRTVEVKVISIDTSSLRLSLSLKQAMADPLFDTLDRLLPYDPTLSPPHDQPDSSGNMSGSASSFLPLPGLADVCNRLADEEGIISISLGRQAVERRVVSQDLQLWLSSAPSSDGKYVLVARAGRQVQEVQVISSLDREQMKEAVQRVSVRDE